MIVASLVRFFSGMSNEEYRLFRYEEKKRRLAERYAADPEYREHRRAVTRAYAASKGGAFLARKRERNSARTRGVGDVVYFMQYESGGPIKIGTTTQNPLVRAESVQTGHWEDIRILGIIHGGRRIESDLHYQFKGLRLKREWFRDSPELRSYIATHATPWTSDGR